MKKQRAEVVDGTEIKETNEQEILYSCENNGQLVQQRRTPHVETVCLLSEHS